MVLGVWLDQALGAVFGAALDVTMERYSAAAGTFSIEHRLPVPDHGGHQRRRFGPRQQAGRAGQIQVVQALAVGAVGVGQLFRVGGLPGCRAAASASSCRMLSDQRTRSG